MTFPDPDPRTWWLALSREDWRRFPLSRVLTHTLDGPALVFRGTNQHWAELLKDDLSEIAEQLRHAGPGMPLHRRKGMLARARRLHVQRVDLAVGYTWPRNPPGWIEFSQAS
jgi:hypothetical protein